MVKKNNIFIGIAVVVVLILFFVVASKSFKSVIPASDKGENTDDTGIAQEDRTGLKGAGSLKELLGYGKNIKCTITMGGDTPATQTMYASGSQMRTDMTIKLEDTEDKVDFHSILDGNMMYSWNTMSTTGSKMDVSKFKDIEDDNKTNNEQEATKYMDNINQKIDYDCSPWTVDSSYFDPPKAITFVDIGEQLYNMQVQFGDQTTKDPASNPCSLCDSLSGDAKVQCQTVACN